MECFCYDIDICNPYVVNNIMNENPCNICDDNYEFILYLKYIKQQSYNGVIQKLVIYNKMQDLFCEMINTKIVWRTIFSSRKTLKINEFLWTYDIPDPWTGVFYGKFILI